MKKELTIIIILTGLMWQLSAAAEEKRDSVPLDSVGSAYTLGEVTVTATQGDKLSSGTRIDRDAMNHLQPTSFSDLLELLPGNISKNPEMGKANTINLRETGNLGANGTKTDNDDYAISSLGTLFMVDGAPLNSDANIQGIGTYTSDSPTSVRNTTNKGVDMRSISTDNIESVEIVKGIPSAEYGNLTSGLVKIKRIAKSTPFTMRFKADEYSKLFAAAKGFGLGSRPIVLNFDLSYLDSRSDPRDNLEKYKRITGSARIKFLHETDAYSLNWNLGGDYTGSFDNAKTDPDLNYMKIDEYESHFNRFGLTSDLQLNLQGRYFFDAFNLNTSFSYQQDRLKRLKQVAPQRASVAPTTMRPGEQTGQYLLGEYLAEYESDGRPMNIFLKGKASGSNVTGVMSHRYLAGIEWTLSKNYGKGQVYDLTKPISAGWTSRPRTYREIPALQVLSFFLEDQAELPIGENLLTLRGGLRSIMIPSLPKDYYLHNRPYLDPRLNASWEFPGIETGGGTLRFSLTGGWGLTTKMPTIDYLYPQAQYTDIVQLNYYDVANPKENSLVSLMTYIDEAVNHNLKAARNRKWEISLGASWKGNSLGVTFFMENLSSGFRYSTIYNPYSYKKYDVGAIDSSILDGPPALTELPYSDAKVLGGYRMATNGTRIDKRGVEFTLSTKRWRALRTKLTVTGAWFKSTYSNSQMLYSPVGDVYQGVPVSERYVGLYEYKDGRVNDQFNTNFMFDTQIPKWGLVFTGTFQFMWWVKSTRLPLNGVPAAYLDAEDGLLHKFPDKTDENPVLKYLIKTYNAEVFNTVKIPFAGYFNLKATKSIGKWLQVSIFVNRILDWLPDYRSNGLLIRRSSDAYFGMEVNLKL